MKSNPKHQSYVLLVLLLAFLSPLLALSEDSKPTLYQNSKFAFQVGIPMGMAEAQFAANSSQDIFVSKDGRSRLKVWAEYNRIEETLRESYRGTLDTCSNDQVTYKTIGKNYYVVSGYRTDGDKVFYIKAIMVGRKHSQIQIFFDMEFPKTYKKIWDSRLVEAVKTFKPTPGAHFQTVEEFHEAIQQARDDGEIVGDDDWKAPSVDFEVTTTNGLAKITWKPVPGAIGYNLYISKAFSSDNQVLEQKKIGVSVNETTWDQFTPDRDYVFAMAPLFRTGEGSRFQKFIIQNPHPKTLAPTNFVIEPRDGGAHLTWDADEGVMFYVIYVSQDGKNFRRAIGTATKNNSADFSGLINGKRCYYAVEPLPYNWNQEPCDWAVQQVIPGSGNSLGLPEEIKPGIKRTPTPIPDTNDYKVEKILELTEARDGFNGQLVLKTGLKSNHAWSSRLPEKYKWIKMKPMVVLLDSNGIEVNRIFFSEKFDTVDLKSIDCTSHGKLCYLVSFDLQQYDKEPPFTISEMLQISNGQLQNAMAIEHSKEAQSPRRFVLISGHERFEKSGWELDSVPGTANQDILAWSTDFPNDSAMHPNPEGVPKTTYTRYRFDGNQWIYYTRTEDGITTNSDKADTHGDLFPDKSFFPEK